MLWDVSNLCKHYENSLMFNIHVVGYLTSPYLLPFHHCWEIRRVRGWLEEREADGERKWEALRELEICWVRNSERTKRQWGGNISFSFGGSSGLVRPPPSARSHRGWMACYIMPASISFFKSHHWSHNTSSAPCSYTPHTMSTVY